MIIRNIVATAVGLAIIQFILISSQFLIMLILPISLVGTNPVEGRSLLYNLRIGLMIGFILLASLTAGYITGMLTSPDTTEWTFPVLTVTSIVVFIALKNLLVYLIYGRPEGMPYYYQFVVVMVKAVAVPVGGYLGFRR